MQVGRGWRVGWLGKAGGWAGWVGWLAGWLGWLAGWLAGWLVGWLAGMGKVIGFDVLLWYIFLCYIV